ncbi:hypothetical protein NC651_025804 [Populus alba x Populus x berolinensis]|nr:hypothetical protein NC651_025804 [Populus alba x Populus x berolinensis]
MAGRGVNWFLKGRGVHPNADEMLKPSFGEPGKCFALKGSSGFVQIKLRGAIVPEAVTLEHVAKGHLKVCCGKSLELMLLVPNQCNGSMGGDACSSKLMICACYGYGGDKSVKFSVAYDRSTAPKDCRVSGWLQNRDLHTADDEEKMLLLTEFTYDLEKSNAQTFNVMDNTASGLVDTVRLDFTSNHGSPSLTCIYRLRVHGYEPNPSSMTAMQP